MLARTKNKLLELSKSIRKMLELIPRITNFSSAWNDCEIACECISDELSKEKNDSYRAIKKLLELKNGIIETKIRASNAEVVCLRLKVLADSFIEALENDIHTQIKVAFFPYKYSMWDSLESIYLSASMDPDCIVSVVPIPYYQFGKGNVQLLYDGDLYPDDIPITSYDSYNLEEEEPDIVFVHNIYDHFNALTRVHENFYSSNLKKYTRMLVFVPYHISTFMEPLPCEVRLAYNIPSIVNVDKVVLANNALKKAAVRDGLPEERILPLGSPKFDALFNERHSSDDYLYQFKNQFHGKKVFLINTGCMYFTMLPCSMRLVALTKLFTIPLFTKNTIVVWRPHPLTRVSIEKYTPQFLGDYDAFVEKIRNDRSFFPEVYLDEGADYIQALKKADVLISADGSLLRSFVATGKPILYWGACMPEHSMLAAEAFYYLGDPAIHWTSQVQNLAAGIDPMKEKRKGAALNAYVNIDGTCGMKVWSAVKESLMEKKYL